MTQSGQPCLRWDSSTLTEIKPAWYRELTGASNHCRNPGQLRSSTWCFSSPGMIETCNITDCSEGTLTSSPGADDTSQSIGNTLGGIIGGILFVAVLVIILFICLVKFKSKKTEVARKRNDNLARFTTAISDSKYVTNPQYKKHQVPQPTESIAIPESFLIIPKERIKCISQLGQGNYGTVYKGKTVALSEGDEEIEVAVKTLKEDASSEVRTDFINEAKLMFRFCHPNILKIFGVCILSDPYQMVFEYMDGGDLTQFLRSHSQLHSCTDSSYSDPSSLSKTQLLHICKQVAAGMAYLASLNHVHCDLACRNCLIDSLQIVKIGDFGMSRNLYSKDYYRVKGTNALPIRWMSPEVLIYGKFTVEGDVWSFGVVMWEVFSYAIQPYPGISNEEVIEALSHGKTLKIPEDCPLEVYNTMRQCWTWDPRGRPKFYGLLYKISHLCQCASDVFTDD